MSTNIDLTDPIAVLMQIGRLLQHQRDLCEQVLEIQDQISENDHEVADLEPIAKAYLEQQDDSYFVCGTGYRSPAVLLDDLGNVVLRQPGAGFEPLSPQQIAAILNPPDEQEPAPTPALPANGTGHLPDGVRAFRVCGPTPRAPLIPADAALAEAVANYGTQE